MKAWTRSPRANAALEETERPSVAATTRARGLSALTSSLNLIGAKLATMGLGFIFWVVAARLFSAHEVGLAAGAVSAAMLCTQLALAGLGSAVIITLPSHTRRPSALLDTTFTMAAASAVIAAAVFVTVAALFFEELSIIASTPLFLVAFTSVSIFGTLGILFDQISTSLRRGDQALARAALFGVATIGLLATFATLTDTGGSLIVFATWVGGGLAGCALAAAQFHHSFFGYGYRPRVDRPLARRLLSIGLRNHALTLAERGPGLVLPIVATELISPSANAAWYAAWMMAWAVYIVPIQIGLTTFADAARTPDALPRLIARGIRSSLVIGGGGAIALAIFAPYALRILGSAYSAGGTTPLRILVVAVIPITFVQAYFTRCRATSRLREATIAASVSGLVGVAGAAVVGPRYGLDGMACVWLATQVLVGVWALWRLSDREVGVLNGDPAGSGSDEGGSDGPAIANIMSRRLPWTRTR